MLEEIERRLSAARPPAVAEGPGRERLKADLLAEMRRTLEKEECTRTFRTPRLAWACGAALLAVATAWGAVAAYRTFVVHNEKRPPLTVTLPTGRAKTFETDTEIRIASDNPSMTQKKASQLFAEIQNQIAQGKYRLLKRETLKSGPTTYTYEFAMSDGTKSCVTLSSPLGSGKPFRDDHQKELEEMIAQGKGTLLEVKETDAKERLHIYRFTYADGSTSTVTSDEPLMPKKP